MNRLVLLAGLLCDEAAWTPVAGRLSDVADIRIISFAGFRSIGDMARHVLDSEPGRFALAGHSMGGRVALQLAAAAPERITALALLNTGVHPAGPGEAASRSRLVELGRTEGMAAVAQAWLPPMMGKDAERTARLMPGLVEMVCRSTPEAFAGQQQALLDRPDGEAAMRSVRVPTLLSSGADDGFSPPAHHAEMQRLAPHAELVIVPDAGHFTPVEQPERVARAMRAWLAAV